MASRPASQPSKIRLKSVLIVGTRSLTICLGILLVGVCFSFPLKARERTIGHVLDIEGGWFLDDQKGRALSKGDELPANGIIRIPSPSRFAFIIIRYSDNRIVSRRCRNAGECEQPVLLPRSVVVRSSVWDFVVGKAMRVIRRDPVSTSVNAGRSSDGALREAVVQIKEGQVDLAPVFLEMNNGTYDVRLERRMSDGKAAVRGSAQAIRVRWESGATTTVPALDLQPGLYQLIFLEKRGAEYRQTLTTAWFFAGNREQYEQALTPFLEAVGLTATWKNDVSEGTARGFLRAFLIYLASQSRPAK